MCKQQGQSGWIGNGATCRRTGRTRRLHNDCLICGLGSGHAGFPAIERNRETGVSMEPAGLRHA